MSYSSILFHLLILLPIVYCSKRLHRGPGRGAGIKKLRGHTLSGLRRGSNYFDVEKIIDFNVEIKKDVVVWDELEEDGAVLSRCRRDASTREASTRISGAGLDPEDFEINAAFIISVEDWEAKCGKVEPVAGVDPADDTLFFKITKRNTLKGIVEVHMEILPGVEVAPVVDISVRDDPTARRRMRKRVEFDPDSETSARALDEDYNSLLNKAAVRPSISHKKVIEISDTTTIEIGAQLTANVRNFRIQRSVRIEAEWEQEMEASVSATLTAQKEFTANRTGEIIRTAIPGVGFSSSIPFVGRITAGAFVKIDWVADVLSGIGFTARAELSYKQVEQVSARLIPPGYDAKNQLTGASASGKASLSFTDESELKAEAVGFAGLRPAMGLAIKFGERGVEGNVGASVGVELSAVIKTPPFEAFAEGGITAGKCDTCHNARAGLSLKGKDLSVQVKVGDSSVRNVVLVKELFSVPGATVCGIERSCSSKPTIPHKPFPFPTATPKPRGPFCLACRTKDDCRDGYTCLNRACKRILKVGSVYGACVKCQFGSTCRLRKLGGGRCAKHLAKNRASGSKGSLLSLCVPLCVRDRFFVLRT